MKECWKQGDTVQPDSQENKAPSNWERSGERACPPGQENVIIGTDQMPFAIIVLHTRGPVAMIETCRCPFLNLKARHFQEMGRYVLFLFPVGSDESTAAQVRQRLEY